MGVLGILLLILKIILYIILGLLLLIVVLISIILFVPIRYKAEGYKDGEEISVEGKLTWLLGIFRFLGKYHKDLEYKAKVLFFTVYSSEKSEDDKESISNDDIQEATEHSIDGSIIKENHEKNNVSDGAKKASTNHSEDIDIKKVLNHYKIEENENQDGDETSNDTNEIESDSSNSTNETVNIEHLNREDNYKVEVSKETIEKTPPKNKDKKETKDEKNRFDFKEILDIIEDEETKIAVKHILKHLSKILKSYLPNRFKFNGVIGTDDPANTAYIIGLTSIIRPMTKNAIDIKPNFTDKELDGEFLIKGRIYFFVLIYHGLRIIQKKEVRHLIKKARS